MPSNAVRIAILGDATKAKQALNETGSAVDRLGKRTSNAGSLLKGALIGGGIIAGVSVLTSKFKEAAQAVQLQEQLMNQTKTVIKSTGNAAGVSAKGVLALSDALEKKSLIDSEEIQKGQNLLLTFTNIKNEAGKGNDVFNQTTRTLVDMSTALGQDTKASAIQLGKALNDPIKGVTALSKVGVSFSADQKNVIKSLVETGNTAGAQKVILKELNKEFGGSAKAAGKTAAGQFKHFKDTIDGVFENIVKVSIPILLKLVNFLQDNVPKAIAAASPYIDKLRGAFDAIRPILEKVTGFIKDNPAAVKAFAITLGILAGAVAVVTGAVGLFNAVLAVNPITLIVVAIAALVAGLVLAYQRSETFRNVVQVLGKAASAVFGAIVSAIRNVITWLSGRLGPTFSAVGDVIKLAIEVWTLPLRTVFTVLKNITSWVYDKLKPAFDWLKDKIGPIAAFIRDSFKPVYDLLVSIVNKINEIKDFSFLKHGGNGVLIENQKNSSSKITIDPSSIAPPSSDKGPSQINVTVNPSPFTNPVEVGREVQKSLRAYIDAGGS